jgi:hypothetical protein
MTEERRAEIRKLYTERLDALATSIRDFAAALISTSAEELGHEARLPEVVTSTLDAILRVASVAVGEAAQAAGLSEEELLV